MSMDPMNTLVTFVNLLGGSGDGTGGDDEEHEGEGGDLGMTDGGQGQCIHQQVVRNTKVCRQYEERL